MLLSLDKWFSVDFIDHLMCIDLNTHISIFTTKDEKHT